VKLAQLHSFHIFILRFTEINDFKGLPDQKNFVLQRCPPMLIDSICSYCYKTNHVSRGINLRRAGVDSGLLQHITPVRHTSR